MRFLKQNNGRPRLTMCTCGKVHFSYGSITLHFEAEEFASFAGAVAHLFCTIRARSRRSTASLDPINSRSYLPLIQEPVHEGV